MYTSLCTQLLNTFVFLLSPTQLASIVADHHYLPLIPSFSSLPTLPMLMYCPIRLAVIIVVPSTCVDAIGNFKCHPLRHAVRA